MAAKNKKMEFVRVQILYPKHNYFERDADNTMWREHYEEDIQILLKALGQTKDQLNAIIQPVNHNQSRPGFKIRCGVANVFIS